MRIMIVEDNAALRQLLTSLFTDAGHEVVAQIEDGSERVEAEIKHSQPDMTNTGVGQTDPQITVRQNTDSAIEQQGVQALKQRFLREHLGAWIAPFSTAVTDAAQTAFYRELAIFTARFVQIETAAQTLH